jgi:hypothetical protein
MMMGIAAPFIMVSGSSLEVLWLLLEPTSFLLCTCCKQIFPKALLMQWMMSLLQSCGIRASRHVSKKGLKILAKKNFLSGMKSAPLKKCTHCLARKQNRVSFKSSFSTRKRGILDLVHSDVCGPMKTRALGGCLYFVTFIDDHSRKLWVYTFKSKD